MDFFARPAPVDLETVNENSATAVSEIMNETDSKGDAWITKCSQPVLTKKKSTKTESVASGRSSTKQVAKVTSGFSARLAPVDLETVNEN